MKVFVYTHVWGGLREILRMAMRRPRVEISAWLHPFCVQLKQYITVLGSDTEVFIFMKKLLFTLAALGCMASAYAQKISEPEYIGQVAVVNADSTTTILPTEKKEVKVNTNKLSFVPVAGMFIGKGRSYMSIKGASSKTTVPSSNVKLVVRVDNNNVDPHKKLGIVKFEVKKKERRYMMAESGLMSGTTVKASYNDLDYKAEKMGASSYLVTLDKVAPGEYGIITEEDNSIVTFSVK